ncbi:hypothetical protein CUMW_137310 [Citrus unshiu]|uniref:Leucine-rich repeat-containing N-terminal plant-type domain-containing protein n=1 Tax=Citrus unshiu TaxID=55188 RepID=A0A2H5PIA2_CITUN|nr:hypothetical protein CUMW_137310 [Citrus unshiu]
MLPLEKQPRSTKQVNNSNIEPEVFSLSSSDVAVMQSLKVSLGNPKSLNWTDPDPCGWSHILCSNDREASLLSPDLKNLSLLAELHVTRNFLSGPIPSLARLSSLQYVYLSNNQFTSIPTDFFSGLTSLKSITLGFNPFRSWQIPESLKDATELQPFSANLANILLEYNLCISAILLIGAKIELQDDV